jgi:hypothetical protein
MEFSYPKHLRDYGLPDFGDPSGKPSWVIADPAIECPNCGSILCLVTVEYDGKRDASGIPTIAGTGKYLGCPACPYASPCQLRIKKHKNGNRKDKEKDEGN